MVADCVGKKRKLQRDGIDNSAAWGKPFMQSGRHQEHNVHVIILGRAILAWRDRRHDSVYSAVSEMQGYPLLPKIILDLYCTYSQ